MPTTNEVILNAYEILGLYSIDRTFTDGEMSKGMKKLNSLFDQFSTQSGYITFATELTFNLVTGQETYSISKTYAQKDVDNIRPFLIKNCRLREQNGTQYYPITVTNDDFYYNVEWRTNIKDRPSRCFMKRYLDRTDITFDAIPDKDYEFSLFGKFVLENLALNDEITQIPKSNIDFLELALARSLKVHNLGAVFDQQSEQQYQEMLTEIKNNAEIDLDIHPNWLYGPATPRYNILKGV